MKGRRSCRAPVILRWDSTKISARIGGVKYIIPK